MPKPDKPPGKPDKPPGKPEEPPTEPPVEPPVEPPIEPPTEPPPDEGGEPALPQAFMDTTYVVPTGSRIYSTDLQAGLDRALPGDEILLSSG